MKLLLIVLTLVPAAAVYSSSAFARELGPSNDAGAVMSRLTSMMGASQQKLGLAERHHKKLVKRIRNEAAAFLQAESTSYGEYLNNYAAELTQSTDDLENAVLVAKAALAKAEAAASSSNDWTDPDLELRARLGAKVAAAERTVKKAQRTRAREVREAEDRSEETMENEAQKLGMKVGDMTPLIDEAKKTLETTVSKLRMPMLPKGLIDEAKKAHVKVAGKVAAKTAVTAKVSLKALEGNVAQATKNNLAKTKDANKKLEGFLSRTDKDVAVKTAKIQRELEQKQTIELEKVLGHKAQKKVTATKNVTATKKAKATKKVAATKKATVTAKVANEVDNERADAEQMRIVADIEGREAVEEGNKARDDMTNSKAVKEAAATTEKSDEARAAKELSTKNDRDAAVAVAQDEKNREDRDAKQMEDIATKEATDAEDTMKDATRMRKDADAIASVVQVENEVNNEKADAEQMRIVADIEGREAVEEGNKARDDMANSKAVKEAAATTEKSDEARAAKELSTKNDRDAAVAVAQDEKNREDRDAKQMEDIAKKEAKDAEDTMKDATRMRKDAAAIEAVVA